MLGLRAWGDDLNVVLFEFLDDDTKLAQSCPDWLYVQHWYTVVPEPSMRVTLWALMGVAKCLKESPALQEANTHRLFIELCWLMDKHAVSADRVVIIDEPSCRLPVQQVGWGRRGVKQAQLQGNAKEATTFTVAFSMDRGPLDMLVQIVHAECSATSRRRTLGHIGRRDEPKPRRTNVDPSLGHGQHPRQRGHRHEGRFPTCRAVLHPATKHFVLAALRCGRLPKLQELHPGAGERHSCPPVFGRMGSSRSHGLLRREQGLDNWVASIACHSDAHFKEAVAEAAALHADDELFSKHIEPEPAPEDPVDWAMAEASDDEDDAPMPDAPPEPEIIDMPPAPASAFPMSNLERCIALRLVYGAGPR